MIRTILRTDIMNGKYRKNNNNKCEQMRTTIINVNNNNKCEQQ